MVGQARVRSGGESANRSGSGTGRRPNATKVAQRCWTMGRSTPARRTSHSPAPGRRYKVSSKPGARTRLSATSSGQE